MILLNKFIKVALNKELQFGKIYYTSCKISISVYSSDRPSKYYFKYTKFNIKIDIGYGYIHIIRGNSEFSMIPRCDGVCDAYHISRYNALLKHTKTIYISMKYKRNNTDSEMNGMRLPIYNKFNVKQSIEQDITL